MKKYVLIGLIMAIVPNICFGASARFTALAREKERKMEELEKCLGSTQGLKIAGLSTLGLTAVGVAGNVYEAKKIDELDQNTKKVEKKIETVEKSISEKQAEIAEKAKADAGEKALAEGGNVSDEQNSTESTVVEGMNIRQAVLRDIERLRNFEPNGVQSTIQLSGYKFCEVPSDLRSLLGGVIESAKGKCKESDMGFTYEDKTYFSESCDKKGVVSGAVQVIAKCVKEVSVSKALGSSTGGSRNLKDVVKEDINNIKRASRVLKQDNKVYTHGYCIHSLPQNLMDELRDALNGYIGDCIHNAVQAAETEQEKANVTSVVATYAEGCDKVAGLTEDSVLTDTNAYILGRCECEPEYELQGFRCIRR